MKALDKIASELNLLYYEYDTYQNKFVVDKNCNKDKQYGEFIKLTYELSKNNIQFFIDENSDVVISIKDSFFTHLVQRVKNFIYKLKGKSKNIFILSDTYTQYAKNLPLINTKPIVNEIDLDKYDALVFTSKKGVIYLDSMNKSWKDIPAYTISTQTAKEVKKLGGSIKFVGKEKHGDEFAKELIPLLKNKQVAFIGAKKIVSKLNEILQDNNIDCEHLPIYETICVEYENKIDLPEDSIIIFSSPSTVKCFFKNVHWKNSFTAISIGKTTAEYIPKDIKIYISQTPSLQSCVQKALSL